MTDEIEQAESLPRPLRVLHIEDNDNDAELARALLEEDGMEVAIHRVMKPDDIETALRGGDCDIILADYSLPAYDGFAALQLHNETLPDVPFVFFAGTMGEDFAIDCLRKGATDYVLKERPQRLAASVRRAMQEAAERRQRRETERALAASEMRYRALYDDNPLMLFTLSATGEILSVNRFAAEHLGRSAAELVGRRCVDLLHEEDGAIGMQLLEQSLAETDRLHRCELRMRQASGDCIWVRQTARPISGEQQDDQVLLVCEDITEARLLSEELSYQATHDMLTGLANRREFEKQLSRLLEACRNNGSEHVLLYLDLDQFKVVNDTCGHTAGDELLRQLGQVLGRKVRRGDIIARLGGDEFGVLIQHCDQQQGLRIAEELRNEIQEFRFGWEDKSFALGASIGLVAINAQSTNVPEIMSAADTACYAAKDTGRNRIQVYYDTDQEMSRRRGEMQWVSRINRALADNRFFLMCQKILPEKADAGEGVHLEMLIRMRDEEDNTVPPNAFLPAAERYNLAESIDRWVINTTLGWLQSRPPLIERIGLCCINISAASLGKEGFQQFIEAALKNSEVPPERLCFEITETAAISHLGNARRFMKTLGELGCRFALDDFGTGMSSFAYLKNLPVQYLKIDGAFVRDIVSDATDHAMVRSIHEIGHVMGKRTIAEFVENDEILAMLRKLGVDYVQGFGIEHPLTLEETTRNLLGEDIVIPSQAEDRHGR